MKEAENAERPTSNAQRSMIRAAVSARGHALVPLPHAVFARCFFANMKPNFSPWRSWRLHQFADGIEDDLELRVIFVFQRGELAREICVRQKHLAQAHKCSHNGDVDLNGARTLKTSSLRNGSKSDSGTAVTAMFLVQQQTRTFCVSISVLRLRPVNVALARR